MVNESRAALRRIDHEQSNKYKQTLAFIIFILVMLTMITTTFLNPLFVKGQLRTSSNQAVVVKKINGHFDNLANLIGASAEDNSNLLTNDQTQPIADHLVDYVLGLHLIRVKNDQLAQQILTDINQNIDKGASSEAQRVRQKLKKQKTNALYFVTQAFNLNIVTLGANVAILLLAVNLILILITAITLWSLISDLKTKSSTKSLVHTVTASGMWAGFWIILICGLLAFIPVIFNVESWPIGSLSYLLEIASGIFLDFVIVGVILYICSAIPWQVTTAK